jgi:hypothetical protein
MEMERADVKRRWKSIWRTLVQACLGRWSVLHLLLLFSYRFLRQSDNQSQSLLLRQLGAWLVETSFGRRQTLALSTLVTALAMFLFSAVSTKTGVVGSSMAISLASTAM